MPARKIDFTQPIPLFPLPSCVLLPHGSVPLHIFEPRYRMMTREALGSRRLIAMAMFEGTDWKHCYEGSPAIRPVVFVGLIVRHEELPSGRFNILLQGLCRARVKSEAASGPYRTALLSPFDLQPPMEIDLTDERRLLQADLDDPLLQQLTSIRSLSHHLSREIPTTVLVDLAASLVCEQMEDRYRLLAEPSVHRRAQWMHQFLLRIRQTLATAEKLGPGKSADGVHLN